MMENKKTRSRWSRDQIVAAVDTMFAGVQDCVVISRHQNEQAANVRRSQLKKDDRFAGLPVSLYVLHHEGMWELRMRAHTPWRSDAPTLAATPTQPVASVAVGDDTFFAGSTPPPQPFPLEPFLNALDAKLSALLPALTADAAERALGKFLQHQPMPNPDVSHETSPEPAPELTWGEPEDIPTGSIGRHRTTGAVGVAFVDDEGAPRWLMVDFRSPSTPALASAHRTPESLRQMQPIQLWGQPS